MKMQLKRKKIRFLHSVNWAEITIHKQKNLLPSLSFWITWPVYDALLDSISDFFSREEATEPWDTTLQMIRELMTYQACVRDRKWGLDGPTSSVLAWHYACRPLGNEPPILKMKWAGKYQFPGFEVALSHKYQFIPLMSILEAQTSLSDRMVGLYITQIHVGIIQWMRRSDAAAHSFQ